MPSFGAADIHPKMRKTWFQGFFLHLIERKTRSRVDRSKGKFRSFLLASLQYYLSNEEERKSSVRRGGKAEFVHLDTDIAEERYRLEPVEDISPEKIFDARWAMEVMPDQDGSPIELDRGAMGITYKAFDVDLRFPVVLKVISEKYVGDESARLRFLREARAAARVRHPNVASVFRLVKSSGEYFYAMEFVEGETGKLDPTQRAARSEPSAGNCLPSSSRVKRCLRTEPSPSRY
jgi:hypothetical protein